MKSSDKTSFNVWTKLIFFYFLNVHENILEMKIRYKNYHIKLSWLQVTRLVVWVHWDPGYVIIYLNTQPAKHLI